MTDKNNLPTCPIDKIPMRKELIKWFKENLPHVKLFPLVFDYGDKDEYINPYRGELAIIGSAKDLKKYSKHWEDDNGDSPDPRFYLFGGT